MEQENPYLQQSSHVQQPPLTLPQQNPSNSQTTGMMIENLGSEDVSNINISQLVKTCQFKEALSLMEAEFDRKRGSLGESNLQLVPLLNQMAEAQIALAGYSKVADLSHQSEQILQNYQEDPGYNLLIAHVHQNLAIISRENKDSKEALDFIHKSLALSSPDSLQNIERYRVKALILCDLEQYKEALQEIQRSLEIVDKSIEIIDQSLAARVYNTLGEIRSTFSDWHQAKIAYGTALEICKNYGLNFHVEMAKAYEGLGSSLIETKKSSPNVLSLAESAEKVYEKCFGEDPHPARISRVLLLARYSREQKDPSKVHEYIDLALEEGEAFYGPDCEKRRDVCLSAAKAAGKLYFKEYFVNPVLETSTQGKNGRELVSLYLQQCDACLLCGNYDLFEVIFPEAVDTIKNIHGDVSLEMAKIYEMIARFYKKKKQLKKMIECLGRYVDVYIKIFGDNHLEIARGCLIFSGVYSTQKIFSQAILYLEQALKIQVEFYGEVHPVVVETYTLLADGYGFNEDPSKSMEIHFKLLRIQEKLGDEKIYETYESIGVLFLKVNDTKSSGSYFRKSYQMARVKLGMDNRRTLDTKEWSKFNAEDKDLLCKSQEILEYF